MATMSEPRPLVRRQSTWLADSRTRPALRLSSRAYWARGACAMEEILDMLTEARALGEELSSDELLVEAIAWRVPAFVALCDLDSARTEAAELRKTAEQAGQPFKLHVAAHYESA